MLISAPAVGRVRLRAGERLWQAVVLAPIALVYLWVTLSVRGAHSFSGDEPHYLAFTQGLWLYHTIDQHRVLYHHDFFAYYPHLMSSHSVHRGGHLYPLHYPGLPLVLLPGFALGGAAGAQVTMIAVAVLVLWRALRLAGRVAGPVAATVAVGMLGLAAPFVLNAGAIYPDLLIGLLLVLAYEALDAPRLSARRALALGLLLAVYPWVHVKLLIAATVYGAWAAYKLWREGPAPPSRAQGEPAGPAVPRSRGGPQRRPLRHGQGVWTSGTLALGLPLLSVAGLMLYNLAFYGSPSPTAPYEGPTLFTGNPLGGLVGQLFAQGQGALGTAPFVLLAIPGAVALWRRDRATALKIGLATLPFWLVTLTYRDWWGGDAPPLRYLLPFLPLWATGIAALLAGLRTASIGVGRWSKVRCAPHEVGGYASPNSLPPTSYSRLAGLAVAALAGVTLALTLAIPAAPRLGWPLPDGAGGLLLSLGHHLGLPLASWLPAFEPTRTGPGLWHNAWLIAPWAAVLLMAWALLAYQARRRQTYD